MWRQDIVIRRIIHNNQGILRNIGKQLLTEPFAKEFMFLLAVIFSLFPFILNTNLAVGIQPVFVIACIIMSRSPFPVGFCTQGPSSSQYQIKSLLWFLFT